MKEIDLRLGILGYGNIGRSLELAASLAPDVDIVGVFTRREVSSVNARSSVFSVSELDEYRDYIDVLAVCYGSSRDLPIWTPRLSEKFNTVDTYDNHAHINEHKARVHTAAVRTGHTSVISLGWDPGLLSLVRLYLAAFIPSATINTFWGKGVSQGHSEALLGIKGVRRAVEYTEPRSDALTFASLISHPLEDTERHRRICYVVAEEGREEYIREEILSMENYFLGYETQVHFIDEDEFMRYHRARSHRGRIYANGYSGVYRENRASAIFDLELGSNPDMTAYALLSGARAAHYLNKQGRYGAYSVYDISPSVFLETMGKKESRYL